MTEFRESRWEDIPELTGLWQQAFGDDPGFIRLFFESGYVPGRSRIAVVNGHVAGMLYWFDCQLGMDRLAYIYAVATDFAFRGMGIATALMEQTHRHLEALGYSGAVLTPGSEELFRFYGRMGYVPGGQRTEIRFFAGKPTELRELEQEEYAGLRNQLLPEGGIRQEGENLAFLKRFARFYGGADFACVISGEGNQCLEFLGNPDKIPGMLGALEIPEAMVRLPGGEKCVCMARWFPGKKSAERFYLGFSFD